MIPILYQAVTEGTVPNDYGIGALTDCLSCEVKEERNGGYELSLIYASQGIHAEDIQPNCVIKAKPNYTDDPQLFRIYNVGKAMNGRFEVSAQHVSYDLSGKVLPANINEPDSVSAFSKITAEGGGNFTITTDISSTADFKTDVPASTRSWFGGKEGSLLDIYGGEWKYDNFTCSLLASRGSDRGVTIRYGKNLTELSQELSLENLVTSVLPYAVNPDNKNVITGTAKSTGLSIGVNRDVAMDFTDKVNWDSSTPVSTQLTNLANNYVTNNSSSLITLKDSITLNFAQSGELKERVDLCDTVRIYFEALGITATAKCVSATWDVLAERYTSNTFGDAKTNIADTIATNSKEIKEKASVSQMQETVNRATELITGNLGGYVVLHDADGDGEPDEILIMDTADITTATNVWRWNKNGLGYSSTGYSGTYGTAITSDGKIVADYVSTGTLNANLIKAGTIEDVNHNSSISLSTGQAILNNLKAKNGFYLIDTNNTTRAEIIYNYGSGTSLNLKDNSANTVATMFYDASTTNGGQIRIYNLNQKQTFNLWGNNTLNEGCAIWINDKDGNNRIFIKGTPNGGRAELYNASAQQTVLLDGVNGIVDTKRFDAKNSSNKNAVSMFANSSTGNGAIIVRQADETSIIDLDGNNGRVTCVELVQTSSRKTKTNIEPIADSEKILELQAVSFDFKNNSLGTNRRGFIAEDVEKVLPNLVTPEEDGRPASLNYVEMIPYLQDVIKKQDERIKKLEQKLNTLEV